MITKLPIALFKRKTSISLKKANQENFSQCFRRISVVKPYVELPSKIDKKIKRKNSGFLFNHLISEQFLFQTNMQNQRILNFPLLDLNEQFDYFKNFLFVEDILSNSSSFLRKSLNQLVFNLIFHSNEVNFNWIIQSPCRATEYKADGFTLLKKEFISQNPFQYRAEFKKFKEKVNFYWKKEKAFFLEASLSEKNVTNKKNNNATLEAFFDRYEDKFIEGGKLSYRAMSIEDYNRNIKLISVAKKHYPNFFRRIDSVIPTKLISGEMVYLLLANQEFIAAFNMFRLIHSIRSMRFFSIQNALNVFYSFFYFLVNKQVIQAIKNPSNAIKNRAIREILKLFLDEIYSQANFSRKDALFVEILIYRFFKLYPEIFQLLLNKGYLKRENLYAKILYIIAIFNNQEIFEDEKCTELLSLPPSSLFSRICKFQLENGELNFILKDKTNDDVERGIERIKRHFLILDPFYLRLIEILSLFTYRLVQRKQNSIQFEHYLFSLETLFNFYLQNTSKYASQSLYPSIEETCLFALEQIPLKEDRPIFIFHLLRFYVGTYKHYSKHERRIHLQAFLQKEFTRNCFDRLI